MIPEICPLTLFDGIQSDNLRQSLSANHLWQALFGYRQTQTRLLIHLEMLRRMECEHSITVLINQACGFANQASHNQSQCA